MEWGVGGGLGWWSFRWVYNQNPFSCLLFALLREHSPLSSVPGLMALMREGWMWNGTESAATASSLASKVMPRPGNACRVPEARPVWTSWLPLAALGAVWVLRLCGEHEAVPLSPWSSGSVLTTPSPKVASERLSVLLLERLYWNKDVYGSPCPSLALSVTAKLGWPTLESGSKIHYSESSALCKLDQV